MTTTSTKTNLQGVIFSAASHSKPLEVKRNDQSFAQMLKTRMSSEATSLPAGTEMSVSNATANLAAQDKITERRQQEQARQSEQNDDSRSMAYGFGLPEKIPSSRVTSSDEKMEQASTPMKQPAGSAAASNTASKSASRHSEKSSGRHGSASGAASADKEGADQSAEVLSQAASTAEAILDEGDAAKALALSLSKDITKALAKDLTKDFTKDFTGDLEGIMTNDSSTKNPLAQLNSAEDASDLLASITGALEEGVDFVRIVRDSQGVAKVSEKTLSAIELAMSELSLDQMPEEMASLIDGSAAASLASLDGLEALSQPGQTQLGQTQLGQALRGLSALQNNDQGIIGLGQAQPFSRVDALSSAANSFFGGQGSEWGSQAAMLSQSGSGQNKGDSFSSWLNSRLESMPVVGNPMSVSREALSVGSSAASASTAIKEVVGQARWAEALGDRVEWIVGQRVQRATILVNPVHLGPIEVSISMEGGKTHAMFMSQNPQVREAIESSIPKLEQMLSNVGVSLGDTHVSANANQQDMNFNRSTHWQKGQEDPSDLAAVSTISVPTESGGGFLNNPSAWVDTFV